MAIEYCKVTGDRNVPSGVVSWTSAVPLSDERATTETSLLPSVTNEQLLDWADAPAHLAYDADWSKGTAPARGRIALSGYVQPSWTHATVVFIRDGDRVDEIRLRWPELRKVSVFKRVVLS